MRTLLAILLALPLAGCGAPEMSSIRGVAINVQNDDAAGFYLLQLRDEECSTIEEDLVVDVLGNSLDLDKAHLRNAVISFRHKGLPVFNGHYAETPDPEGLHYWMVRRESKAIWYYIGTRKQYAAVSGNLAQYLGPERTQPM